MTATPNIVLASASRYRAELLRRIIPGFTVDAADIDESAQPGEAPLDLVRRLARQKAGVVAARHPGAIVIGSDQLAMLDGEILGKPGRIEVAREQLRRCSGREVCFLTALCVLGGSGTSESAPVHVDVTRVGFRTLDDAEIERHLALEPALDCAGSFKVESRGVVLFDYVRSEDPTALVGLPLIALAKQLRATGLVLP